MVTCLYKYGLNVVYNNGFMFKFIPYALKVSCSNKGLKNNVILNRFGLIPLNEKIVKGEISEKIKELMNNYEVKY